MEQISSPPSAVSATASRAERRPRLPGSISRRILLLSLAWIAGLTLVGGLALDRLMTTTLVRNFDAQLAETLPIMIAAAELDPWGDVRFNRPPAEPRFEEPYSGRYWQVSAKGKSDFRSRSLWDRTLALDLDKACLTLCTSRDESFEGEPLRLVEQDAIIPGSPTVFRFAVAASAATLDAEIAILRRTLWLALGALALGLVALAALQAGVGLLPLRRMSATIADIRAGRLARAPEAGVPPEIAPLVAELNALLDHNAAMTEAARMHAGNLAHALKTPLSVLLNEAAAESPDLAATVRREALAMRRHIDHHLARARASARRANAQARAPVWPVLERLQRAVGRIYADRGVVIDIAGDRGASFRGEAQDLEEMVGNLVDNAAKYGGGRVFVTVAKAGERLLVTVEDDGPGIPQGVERHLFERGARLDTRQPGTGLGLAIVRDIAGMYGGSVSLARSEDLGGLMVALDLPAAPGA
nr:HAMP domain-containing sensor histidine kinase [Thermaurantiacus tibetensis]